MPSTSSCHSISSTETVKRPHLTDGSQGFNANSQKITASMTQEGDRPGKTHNKKNSHRPSLTSHASSSVPSTPRQHARDTGRARTPSPHRLRGRHSPQSVSSESTTTMPFLKPTVPTCRFQSTQTNRRRIKYTIGTDLLEPEKEEPKRSLDNFEEKKLSADLRALYEDLLPTSNSQASRESVVEKLKNILQEEWPDRTLEVSVFGSSGNLLNTSKSDVDICITVKSLETVCALAEVLARRGMKNVTCVHAKAVPIVKIWDPQYQMACDLNVNNHVALKNTRMVKAYMELDERVRPLALIIKYWTKRRILNEASGGTLSSYTWTLLVIHFLQTRPTPVLPVLAINDERGQPRQSFDSDVEQFKPFGQANNETLAELFFHFFRRYGHEIDYETAVMSVRHGKMLTKKEKNWHLATNNRLCVEEPFNTDRNLGNTADDTAFRGLHLELRQAFSRIAEGKDLVASVCEQYEYPPEDPKPIFERPQAGPRPILSRSTSQSGRGGRRRGGGRGNHEHRGGGGARRSSSAATFGHPAYLGIQSPGILMPGTEYFFGAGAPMLSAADLETLSRQLDQRQQQLRMQQFQIQQAQLQAQHHAAQAMAANQQRSSSASTPLQQYSRLQNGAAFSSPQIQPAEMAPTSAPLNAPWPFNATAESSVPMSHSSSAQDGGSHSDSPRLAPATPHRRGFQRGMPQIGSPGGAARSQSQPARAAGQTNAPGSARLQHATPSMQHQFPMSAARPFYMGPYMGPYGSYYLAAPSTDSMPREYLGYGIGAPQYIPAMREPSQMQIPPYEELVQQGRQISPSRRHSTMVATDLQLPRSPSPQSQLFSDTQDTAVGSPTTSIEFGSAHQEQQHPRAVADDGPPIVANGSYYPAIPKPAHDAETRRVSEPSRRPTFGSEAEGSNADAQIHRVQSSQSFAARIGASLAATEKARKERLNFFAGEDSDRDSSQQQQSSNKKASSTSQQDMPPPPRPSDARSQKSPESANGTRHGSSSNRGQIPTLDLGASHSTAAERLREQQPILLSPVEERRTPSPAWHRNSLPANGMSVPILPTPPTPLARNGVHRGAGDANDAARGPRRSNSPVKGPASCNRPVSQTFLPSETAHLGSQQAHPGGAGGPSSWTQAGKGKKKKGRSESNEKSAGGHVMPENVAERKGG